MIDHGLRATWYQLVEEKRGILVIGITSICVLMLILTARRLMISADGYWHLQTGLDWLNYGLSPWIDHFSFTFSGQEISSQPVIFQAIIAWLVNQFGLEVGLEIFKASGFLAAFGLFFLFLVKLRSPVIVYLLVLPLMVVLIQQRSLIRPELISYSFSIIAVLLYHRARGRVSANHVLPMALLMLIWSNYHTPILGYIIFFGFFIDAAYSQFRDRASLRKWIEWLAWGLLILCVGYLHRGLSHPVIGAASFAPEWKELIQEYQSAALYRNVRAFYGLIVLIAATLALAASQRKWGYFIVVGLLCYFAANMARLVTPCGIIVLAIFASLLSELDIHEWLRNRSRLLSGLVGFGVLIIFSLSVYSGVINTRWFLIQDNRTALLERPGSMVRYMKENQLDGNIFNLFGLGGFLIYSLSPESKVYIDGRTNILYPIDHYKRYFEAKTNPDTFMEEVVKYDINLAIFDAQPYDFMVMKQTDEFGLDFVDSQHALFTRGKATFSESGNLLGAPACWTEQSRDQLEAELISAHLYLPPYSALTQPLGMMVMYSNTENKREFLEKLAQTSIQNVHQLRFLGYQALSQGLHRESAHFFEQIEDWYYKEFLAAVINYVELGDFDKAENLLNSLSSVDWPYVSKSDITLHYRILETIKRSRGLEIVSRSTYEAIKNQANSVGISASNLELDPNLLCDD